MKMGIERVLKEKFGDAVRDIRQVYDEDSKETTVEVSFWRVLLLWGNNWFMMNVISEIPNAVICRQ